MNSVIVALGDLIRSALATQAAIANALHDAGLLPGWPDWVTDEMAAHYEAEMAAGMFEVAA